MSAIDAAPPPSAARSNSELRPPPLLLSLLPQSPLPQVPGPCPRRVGPQASLRTARLPLLPPRLHSPSRSPPLRCRTRTSSTPCCSAPPPAPCHPRLRSQTPRRRDRLLRHEPGGKCLASPPPALSSPAAAFDRWIERLQQFPAGSSSATPWPRSMTPTPSPATSSPSARPSGSSTPSPPSPAPTRSSTTAATPTASPSPTTAYSPWRTVRSLPPSPPPQDPDPLRRRVHPPLPAPCPGSIRYFGFLACRHQQKLALCRRLLDMPPPQPSEPAPDYHDLFEAYRSFLAPVPGLSPRAPVRGGALRAGRAPAAGGFLMITARWAQPPPLPRPSSRSSGTPASFRTPQARLPAPSRPTQSPEPLRKRLSVSILQSRPHAPGGPPSRSWAGHAMPIAAVPAVQSTIF